MPAVYTHYRFTEDIYNSLDEKLQNIIDEDIFNMFGKSFDILYFKDRTLGKKGHNSKVNLYFKLIVEYIINNDLKEDKQILAYLYGSICHYVLDSTIHPYVFYKTGKFNVNDKNTYKYKGKHDYIEYMIDAIYYKEKTNKNIRWANLDKVIFPKVKFSKELSNCLNDVLYRTFKVGNSHVLFKKGYRNFRLIYKHGMCSKFGIKYMLYKLVDKFNLVKSKRLVNACYYIKKLDYSVLNKDHDEWFYPVQKKLKYHYSVDDLYDIALIKAKDYIIKLNNAIHNIEFMNQVLKEIGNISYTSGVSVEKKLKMKYFEY